MQVALEQEYKFFLSNLISGKFSKKHLHKFVLIKGEEVIDFCDSYDIALRQGLSRFGSCTPFFIEEVKREEVIHYYHGIK